MAKGGIFIAGTGTDVGKTYVSAFLLDYFKRARKKKVLYYKPIQCGQPTDMDLIKKLTKLKPKEIHCSYNLKTPSSPHFAFAKENVKFEKNTIRKFLASAKKQCDFIVMEAAGGVRVPIAQNFDMADLAKLSSFKVLLVAAPGLGTINHALLSIDYLKSKRIEMIGFVFSPASFVNELTEEIIADNAKTIEKISGVPYKGTALPISGNF
ncbi:dethiobiotin synthase [Fibrobacteria bacterium R8-3-H12]